MNIILCGLPLSGKSQYAKQLSEFLEWPLIDTDILLENLFKKENNQILGCKAIREMKGEDFFRDLERRVILSIKDIEKSIISIGGGTIITTENILDLKKLGKLVYLKTEINVLLDRLKKKSHIPAYLDSKDPSSSFLELIKSLLPMYEKHCDAIVSTNGLSDIEVLARISSHMV
jgi:shikimate kinase